MRQFQSDFHTYIGLCDLHNIGLEMKINIRRWWWSYGDDDDDVVIAVMVIRFQRNKWHVNSNI